MSSHSEVKSPHCSLLFLTKSQDPDQILRAKEQKGKSYVKAAGEVGAQENYNT